MAENSPKLTQPNSSDHLRFLLTFVLAVGVVYVGRSVILPLALAVLLTFVMTPMVMAVQRRGLARVPSVLMVLLFSSVVITAVGYGVGTQVSKLADQLPDYTARINAKINSLRKENGGPLSRALDAVEGIGASADESQHAHSGGPMVVVMPQETSAFGRLSQAVSPVIEPVADALLILILVTFMLIRREDLRNRIIGLLGHGRLTGTTRVFVESAERISRLLLMQLCVNTAFGIVFGLILLAFGVQYWFLWGFLTVVLRFVPFVGSWLAAMMPVLLTFAVAPGWTQPLLVLGSFIALDTVTANVIEPLLFGHSTGVTPVALLVAAVFWAWIWGPVGLVLSTPLTVCLVVMGQNIPSLRFLALLMGDKAALEPHVAYYQRLLAGDRREALLVAQQFGISHGWDQLPDGVVMPAINLARKDRKLSGLTAEDEAFIFDSTEDVIEHMQQGKSLEAMTTSPPLILGCAAHHRVEELSVQLLSKVMGPSCHIESISTRTLPVDIERRVEKDKPALVFIAVVPPGGISQARHLCKRLCKHYPDLKIVIGYFGKVRDFDRLLTTLRSAGASSVATSVLQSRNQIQSLLPAPAVSIDTTASTGEPQMPLAAG